MLLSIVVIFISVVIYRLQFRQGPPGRLCEVITPLITKSYLTLVPSNYIARDGYSEKRQIQNFYEKNNFLGTKILRIVEGWRRIEIISWALNIAFL